MIIKTLNYYIKILKYTSKIKKQKLLFLVELKKLQDKKE